MDKDIEKLAVYMTASKKTVAITGAGISYLYGVGRLKQMMDRADLTQTLSPTYVKNNPETFYATMREGFLDATFDKGPSPVHKQLVEFERLGLLQGIITNNMDCLHQIAGSTNVIEIQGGFDDNICTDCGERIYDYGIWNAGMNPRCPKCGGPMMPANFCRTAASHDAEFEARMKAASDMLVGCDLIIIIATTGFLSENYMGKVRRSTKIVQINPSHTKFDSMATLNIRSDAESVFKEILKGF